MKKIKLIWLALLAPMAFGFGYASQQVSPVKQKAIIAAVNECVKEEHFQPKPIDDNFSGDVFN